MSVDDFHSTERKQNKRETLHHHRYLRKNFSKAEKQIFVSTIKNELCSEVTVSGISEQRAVEGG